jgi:hypothetical protein
MRPPPLDNETADRLVSGWVAPEGAPPGYAPVVRLLGAASAEFEAEKLTHESEKIAAFALAVRSSEPANSVSLRRFSMPFVLTRVRLVAAAAAAALAATASLASAGSLPGAAQEIASEMLAKVGVSVPGPNDHAGTHPDGRGSGAAPNADEGKGSEISELARTTDATGVEKGAVISTAASEGKSQAGQNGSAGVADTPSTAGKGGEISELARTTDATGVEKGAVISTAASEGKSQAGQNGSTSGAGNGGAPATGSNGGGTGTADTASGGSSSQGTSTADAASGGHSSAGSANAGSGNSQKP